MKKIYVIAGEASGDLHGANLIRHLRGQSHGVLDIYGVGGNQMRDEGVRDFYDLAHFHVTGLTDAVKKFPEYRRASVTILSSIKKARPDLVVLIDNPGFNLYLAKKIHALGIPIVYFIAPQVWAWAPRRVLTIKKYVKKVLVVFQFEKKFFEDYGVPVSWVGHPLKDLIAEKLKNSEEEIPREKKGPTIALLPGSRTGELKTLFPLFLKAGAILLKNIPKAALCVIQAPTLPRAAYDTRIHASGVPVTLIEKNSYDAIRSSDLAIVCSGTATLECALLGTPMIIANRGSLLTYLLAKSVLRVDCLGLPNLILGQKKFPELLQYDATPEKIAAEAVKLLEDKTRLEAMRQSCAEVSRQIGEAGAAKRAAQEILTLLDPSKFN